MFSSLTREHHWHPKDLECLFFDRSDYRGLWFQWDDLKDQMKEAKEKSDKLKDELNRK